MVEVKPKSYKERQREARAAASAKRQAAKDAWRREIELRATIRRLSLECSQGHDQGSWGQGDRLRRTQSRNVVGKTLKSRQLVGTFYCALGQLIMSAQSNCSARLTACLCCSLGFSDSAGS
jgi:hypothetical protein